jgi:hypothetical protein
VLDKRGQGRVLQESCRQYHRLRVCNRKTILLKWFNNNNNEQEECKLYQMSKRRHDRSRPNRALHVPDQTTANRISNLFIFLKILMYRCEIWDFFFEQKPSSGTSVGRSMRLICSISNTIIKLLLLLLLLFKKTILKLQSGDSPPCTQNIFSSMIAI